MDMNKMDIAKQIKNISLDQVNKEFDKLVNINNNINIGARCKIGNNIVDYFTFCQRLETKGKYNVNFFEFLEQIDTFREKKFIQNMLTYYKNVKNKNNTKNEFVVYKEVYNICISAINIMRPLNCMEFFSRYHSKRVLNFCAGWGGSTVAAAALHLDAHYGIDINQQLKQPYENMMSYLKTKSPTELYMFICDATTFDYSTIEYDTVFASPPYYFIEKYENNVKYDTKTIMNEQFYKPLFLNSFQYLKKDGHFIINICKEVYDNVLIKLFGVAHEIYPLKKSKRQNDYCENVYVWNKN